MGVAFDIPLNIHRDYDERIPVLVELLLWYCLLNSNDYFAYYEFAMFSEI